MNKSILIAFFVLISAFSFAQSEESPNTSVFVLSFDDQALADKKTVKEGEVSIDKATYMTEDNGLVILGFETIYPMEYINTLDKDALKALLEKINSNGFTEVNNLMGATPEKPSAKNIKFKNAAEAIQTDANVNGLAMRSTTMRSQNNFLQIIFVGEVSSKQADNFMNEIEIIVVE